MSNYAPSGQVLAAGVSVLPATTAAALIPLQLSDVAGMVVVFAGMWAVSYVALSMTLRIIRK